MSMCVVRTCVRACAHVCVYGEKEGEGEGEEGGGEREELVNRQMRHNFTMWIIKIR